MSFFIVILSYNHPHHTARAIESALQLTDQVGLVHNGSEATHREFLKAQFPQISHWEIYPNRGFSGGANFGLKNAFRKSNWVIFLTNDCEIINLPTLPTEPAFIAPAILKRKTEKLDSIGGIFTISQARLTHCRSELEFQNILARANDTQKPYIPGSAFLIHKSVFEKTGDFRESLGTYWEDVDFSLRALAQAQKLNCQAQWRIRHKIGKTCHKDSHYTTYLYQRNRKRVTLEHARLPQLPSIVFHLLKNWVKLAIHLTYQKRWSDLKKLIRAILD